MESKKFHREEYPLDILASFGLTEEMIYDLPGFVHEIIEMGGKSPLLPIVIEQPFGYTKGYAKFCLVEYDEGLDVIFFPKLKAVLLEAFEEQQRQLLLMGKVIVADIDDTYITDEGVEETHSIKAFVQLDKETNAVMYCPTQIIGRNLNAIANEYDISGDQLKSFWDGEIVTVFEENEFGEQEPVTIGIDLFSENGVVVVPGNEDRWQRIVRPMIPTYNFGNDGCWINRNGLLSYISEKDFTPEIYKVLERQAAKSGLFNEASAAETIEQSRSHQQESQNAEESRQLTR